MDYENISEVVSESVSDLLALSVKCEYEHLKARNLMAHEVLGDLYKLLYQMADDTYECAKGFGLEPEEAESSIDAKDYNDILSKASKIVGRIGDTKIECLTKLASDFSADISKIAYKLDMCK